MLKIKNKGFALAETLVVSVFVMTIFTLIYTNFFPMMGEFERREKYDDIDSIYRTYLIKSMFEIPDFSVGRDYTFISNDINNPNKRSSKVFKSNYVTDPESGNVSMERDNVYCKNIATDSRVEYCKSLFTEIKAYNVYIAPYKITDLKKAIKENRISKDYMDSSTQDYIASLPYYSKPSQYSYRIIVEYIKEINKESSNHRKEVYSFSTIGVRL